MLGTFEPLTVVSEASCVKIEPHIPLDKAALVGCGVTTGWGSAVNAADVRAGETVVVVGLGGIGMNAVQGARLAGADKIVAVDPLENKRSAAATFGATHYRRFHGGGSASSWPKSPRGAMADKSILTVSVAYGDLIAPLLNLTKKAGRAVVTAVAPISQTDVKLDLFMFAMMRKELVGCIFGNANPRRDIPRILDLYMNGRGAARRTWSPTPTRSRTSTRATKTCATGRISEAWWSSEPKPRSKTNQPSRSIETRST